MNTDLYTQRKNSQVLEVKTAEATIAQLDEINNELALGFSPQELESIQAYFKQQKRNPTDVELQTISQTWSEHCCHKTFKGKIKIDGKEILFESRRGKLKALHPIICSVVIVLRCGFLYFNL